MNAIETLNRVNLYCDVTRNGRYYFSEISAAVNDAIQDFMNEKIGDEKHQSPENFQWIQQIRDDLYTLIATSSPSVTNGTAVTTKYHSSIPSHFNYPADYYGLISIRTTVSGESTYARPTTYGEVYTLLEDSFKYPRNEKPYYVEDATGYTIWRGTTGTMTVFLEYIKIPNTFDVGQEADLIDAGAGVLVNATAYIATQVSVHNGVTYQIGDQFTSANTNLTSGQVILAANTTAIDLPEKAHDEIAKRAAEILLGVTSNIQQSTVAEKFVKQGS